MITQKQRVKAAKIAMMGKETPFAQISRDEAPHMPIWMSRVFRNNRFTVMIIDDAKTTKGPAIRAMVQRHDNIPIPRHWSEMQRIKNEIFGAHTTAIEYYPAVENLVDQANIYWMWIYPEGVIPIPVM